MWDSPAWGFVWHVQNPDLNHQEIMTTTLPTQQRIKHITDLATNCVKFKLKMHGSVAKPTLNGSEKVDPSVRWGGPVWTLRYRVWNSPCRNAKSKLARLPTVQIWVYIHFANPLCLSIFGSLVLVSCPTRIIFVLTIGYLWWLSIFQHRESRKIYLSHVPS